MEMDVRKGAVNQADRKEQNGSSVPIHRGMFCFARSLLSFRAFHRPCRAPLSTWPSVGREAWSRFWVCKGKKRIAECWIKGDFCKSLLRADAHHSFLDVRLVSSDLSTSQQSRRGGTCSADHDSSCASMDPHTVRCSLGEVCQRSCLFPADREAILAHLRSAPGSGPRVRPAPSDEHWKRSARKSCVSSNVREAHAESCIYSMSSTRLHRALAVSR